MRPALKLLLLLLLASCAGTSRPSTFRVAAAGCAPCRPEALAAELAGAGAEDCGWARTAPEVEQVRDCALRALQTGRPFRALQTGQGIDSVVIHAFVRTADGQGVQLTSDSDPGGGQRACRAVVTRTPCTRLLPDPSGRSVLVCEAPGRGERVCAEQAQRTAAAEAVEDARLLACNPLPGEGRAGACLRLQTPSGNVPPGLHLTCEPLTPEVPTFLLCRPQAGDLQRTRGPGAP